MSQRPLHELGDELSRAREAFYDTIADVEFNFAQIAVCPATIPLYEFQGRKLAEVAVRQGRKVRLLSPVAYLHFDGEHLLFSQVARPFPEVPLRNHPRCPACRTFCLKCQERRNRARRQWIEREAAKTEPVQVLDIEDGSTLRVISGMLPEMHQRLVDDSKVTPEEIEDAIRSVQDFLKGANEA